MAIINPGQAPAEDTKVQKQKKTRDQIDLRINQIYRSMKSIYQECMGKVWQNPSGLTPQEVFDYYGPDAKSLVDYATALATALNAAVPDSVPANAPLPLTVNNDGTVTVGE